MSSLLPPPWLLQLVMMMMMMMMKMMTTIDAERLPEPASKASVSAAKSSLSVIRRMELIKKNALHSERSCKNHSQCVNFIVLERRFDTVVDYR